MARSEGSTQEALLQAAEKLFAERGYEAVGIRDLAAEAGVNIAAIKYHFGSKRELYLDTVKRSLEAGDASDGWELLREQMPSRRAAACRLVRFLRRFLTQLLLNREMKACVKLMLQEALRPSEALETVVVDYLRQYDELLAATLSVIAPEETPEGLQLLADSVMGQVVHYVLFLPMFEAQGELDLTVPASLRRVADHIARFSLRGMGCSPRFVAKAIAEADEEEE